MKNRTPILLALASIALLSSCGGDPVKPSSSSSESSSQSGTVYTFEDAYFTVVADYGGSKVSYPHAKAESGDYPAITDLTIFHDEYTAVGRSGVQVGYSLCVSGTFRYADGVYKIAGTGATLDAKSCNSGNYVYDKANGKFVSTKSEEYGKAFYDMFGDASHYAKVIGTDGTLKDLSELEDQTTVQITTPTHYLESWVAEETFTIDYDYVAVYLLQ